MDLLLTWFVAPAALLAITVGLSLLVERICGFVLPWLIRPGLGLATAMVIAQFGVSADATAELTAPFIVLLALFGFTLGYQGRLLFARIPRRELLGALGVYAVFASPFLASGEATWAGYIKLDDTATWMGLTDHAFEYGRRIEGFEPSTFEALVQINAGNGYPIGSFVPMELLSWVSGEDIAWTIQPSMALMAFVLALSVAQLLRPVIPSPGWRAITVFLGTQAALLLGYSLWGGVKEVALAALLPLGPLVAATAIREGDRARVLPWVPIGIYAAAFVACFGPGGAVWVLPSVALMVPSAVRQLGVRRTAEIAAGAAALALALSLPQIVTPNGIFDPFQAFLFEETELGNLPEPLSPFQVGGVWPAEDFRFDPSLESVVKLAALVVAALAVLTLYLCRRRNTPLLAYVGGSVASGLVVFDAGSPWVDGKAMAAVSPALLTAAFAALVVLGMRAEYRLASGAIGAALAGLVLWGSFLAYQGAWLAPRDRNEELEAIGKEFAGQGPTLDIEHSSYGGRHFLRRMDAEGAFDLRRRQVLRTDGRPADEGGSGDPDEIAIDQLAPYRTLIVERSPATSRPPSDYSLVRMGRFYEVWQRIAPSQPGRTLVSHMALGEAPDAGGVPNCAAVSDLATQTGPSGVLVAARTADPVAVDFEGAILPASQQLADRTGLIPTGDGSVSVPFVVEGPGTYEVWLGGSIYGPLEVEVDGRLVSRTSNALNAGPIPQSVGTIDLAAGRHSLTLRYEGAGLTPGSGAEPAALTPLLVDVESLQDLGTVAFESGDFKRLCNRRWDWIEGFR